MTKEIEKQKTLIKTLSMNRLAEEITALGHPAYRADQVADWLYVKFAQSFEMMSNLPGDFRNAMSEKFSVDSLGLKEILNGNDGTTKLIFRLHDGLTIESVLIPDRKRTTICISTQVGCAMECGFCLTGKMGFIRNLDTSEIIDQYILARRHFKDSINISHVVFMGMGEPLANYNNFHKALKVFTEPWGFAMSPRRITFSTMGLPESIRRAATEFPPVGLAVSLNAPDDELRATIMPTAKKKTIKEIIEAAAFYAKTSGGELTFEYVLLGGVNDSISHARKLAKLIRGLGSKVNIIPYNQSDRTAYWRPDENSITNFQNEVRKGGIPAFIRNSRGRDIGAACGQLGSVTASQSPASKAPVTKIGRPPSPTKKTFVKRGVKPDLSSKTPKHTGKPRQDDRDRETPSSFHGARPAGAAPSSSGRKSRSAGFDDNFGTRGGATASRNTGPKSFSNKPAKYVPPAATARGEEKPRRDERDKNATSSFRGSKPKSAPPSFGRKTRSDGYDDNFGTRGAASSSRSTGPKSFTKKPDRFAPPPPPSRGGRDSRRDDRRDDRDEDVMFSFRKSPSGAAPRSSDRPARNSEFAPAPTAAEPRQETQRPKKAYTPKKFSDSPAKPRLLPKKSTDKRKPYSKGKK